MQRIEKRTIDSKINVTPKGVYLPLSKLHAILAVANLLAHNNKSQICYCGQISLQSAAVNCSFPTLFGVTFILLPMVQQSENTVAESCVKWKNNWWENNCNDTPNAPYCYSSGVSGGNAR